MKMLYSTACPIWVILAQQLHCLRRHCFKKLLRLYLSIYIHKQNNFANWGWMGGWDLWCVDDFTCWHVSILARSWEIPQLSEFVSDLELIQIWIDIVTLIKDVSIDVRQTQMSSQSRNQELSKVHLYNNLSLPTRGHSTQVFLTIEIFAQVFTLS